MAMKKETSIKKSGMEEEEVSADAMSLDDTTAAADAIVAADVIEEDDTNDNDDSEPNKKKKEKKPKKKSKKRSNDEGDDDNGDDDDDDDEKAKSSKEERKLAKAALKQTLLSQIPTTDPITDLPWTKTQIRRMKRRVKGGLHPIATPAEEDEIRQRAKRERMEEEKLYALTAEEEADENKDDGNDESKENEEEVTNANDDDDNYQAAADNESTSPPPKKKKRHNPPSKNTKRSKDVPKDYICQACKNKPDSSDDPNLLAKSTPHWIYDCPLKTTKKGCNAVAKKLRGLHDPPDQKVFVTGLPFDCDEGSVKRFFEDTLAEKNTAAEVASELVHVKLLKFEDSKRCKGTAFLMFDSAEGAKAAIRFMNNSIWREVEEPGTSTKKKKGKKDAAGGGEDRKELKLRVSKVLNRFVTKQKGGGSR